MYSRFVVLRIRPAGHEIRRTTAGTGLPVRRLLAEWPADQDEPVQFWLSHLPETTQLSVLVRTAKRRRRIENDYREMRQALSPAHFEGRTWPGWHHHGTLVSVAHAFRTLQRMSRSPKETASARASTESFASRRHSRNLDRRLPHRPPRHAGPRRLRASPSRPDSRRRARSCPVRCRRTRLGGQINRRRVDKHMKLLADRVILVENPSTRSFAVPYSPRPPRPGPHSQVERGSRSRTQAQ